MQVRSDAGEQKTEILSFRTKLRNLNDRRRPPLTRHFLSVALPHPFKALSHNAQSCPERSAADYQPVDDPVDAGLTFKPDRPFNDQPQCSPWRYRHITFEKNAVTA